MLNTEEIQKELLEQMKEFDAVCRRNGINYSLHGGTMLGAIRHHGFIPWDDDIDITMMSSDFQRFKALLPTEMPSYHLSDDVTPTARLMRNHYGNRPFAWIDILEYNFISTKLLSQKLKLALLTIMIGICRTKTTVKSSTVKKHGRIKVVLLHILYYIGQLFPIKSRINLYKRVSRNWFLGDKELIHRTNDQAKSIRYILPKKYMEEYIDVDFEDAKLMISRYYDDILTVDFGKDYMTPPPKAEQTAHEDVVREMFVKLQQEYEANHA